MVFCRLVSNGLVFRWRSPQVYRVKLVWVKTSRNRKPGKPASRTASLVICWTIRVQSAPVALYADGTFRSMSESYLSIIPHAQLVHAPRPRPRRRLQGSRCLDEERGPRRSASCLTMPINDACQPAACQTTTACQTTAAYKIAVQHLPPHVKARCGAPRRWAPWPQIQAAQMGVAVLLWAPGPVNVFDTLNNSLRLLTRTRSRPRNKEK